MKLENRVAIVTGGANGIGRGITLALAKEGADVIVADLEMEVANAVVSEVRGLGRKAMAIKVNVAKSDDTRRMVKDTLAEFGKIDILVNDAGGTARERRTSFHESKEEIWDYVLGINLIGVFNCTRAVINHMIERQSGKIVNIASIAGMIGDSRNVEYSAAKAGIIGFTMALAKEVAEHGININTVSPGAVMTRAIATNKALEQTKQSTRMGRVGTPEDIAAMVLFLVSDEASYITGQNFPVCGLSNLGAL